MFSAAIEFWVIVQVVVDLLLIILFIIFMRQIKTTRAKRATSGVKPLSQVLEPLLKEAEEVARLAVDLLEPLVGKEEEEVKETLEALTHENQNRAT